MSSFNKKNRLRSFDIIKNSLFKVISTQVQNYSSVLSFRLNNCNLRSSSCSFLFRILILTSCMLFFLFLSLCPCSLTVSKLQFGSFVCSSLKRLSSCLFSEVFLPLSNSTILSGRTGRYEEVDDRLFTGLDFIRGRDFLFRVSR